MVRGAHRQAAFTISGCRLSLRTLCEVLRTCSALLLEDSGFGVRDGSSKPPREHHRGAHADCLHSFYAWARLTRVIISLIPTRRVQTKGRV